MPEIRVRFAEQDDLAFVSQDRYISGQVVARKIEEREVMVAEWDNRLAGYLRLEYLWSLVPYISLITVAVDYRRQGLGRQFMGLLAAILSGQGYRWLHLDTASHNHGARHFYRTLGFRSLGMTRSYVRHGE